MVGTRCKGSIGGWRWTVGCIGLITISLTGSPVRGNDVFELVDRHPPGDVQRVKVVMEARGELQGEDEKSTYPMSATAQAVYQERWYADEAARRTARHYEKSIARLMVGESSDEVQLGDNKRVIVVQAEPRSAAVYRAIGAQLSRRELDTLRIPGNSQLLNGMLPGEPVRAGDSWVPDAAALAGIMQLDEVTAPEVRCTLTEVDRGLAKIQFHGQLIGRVDGAVTAMDVSGELRCDLATQRIRWFQLKLREERDAGPTSPPFKAVAEVRMLLESVAPADQLAFPSAIAAARPEDLRLEFTSSESGLRFLHEPNWTIVDDRARATVLRWMDGGRVFVQCNMSRLASPPNGKPLTLEALQADVRSSLGEKFREFEFARQETRKDGTHVLRVVANGEVEEGRVVWIFCHLTGPNGDRLSMILTMDAASAKEHQQADQLLVESLQFVSAPAEQAQLPQPNRARQ